MPQKNEGRDRLEVLAKSREFNPVIEFEVNSPQDSSQRTSAPIVNSSRSNSETLQLTKAALVNEPSYQSTVQNETLIKKAHPNAIEVATNQVLINKDSTSATPK